MLSLVVGGTSMLHAAVLGVSLLRGRLFAAISVALFGASTALWLVRGEPQYEFASTLTGGAVLCAAVLLTSGWYRRLASAKMLGGVLTQASVSYYKVLPQAWHALLGEAQLPTDAMILSLAIVVPCAVVVLTPRRTATVTTTQTLLVTVVHGLLVLATLAARFHRIVSRVARAPTIGPALYATVSSTALLLAVA